MNSPDQAKLRQGLAEFCMIAMFCISVTLPAITLSSSLPYFKAEQLLLPFIVIVYIWMLLAGIARKIRFNGLFLVGLCYCVSSVISIWYGAAVLGHDVIVRDFYELPKLWLPVAFFTLAYEAELTEDSLRRLLQFLAFAVLLVCVYAWCQWIGLGFTDRLNLYYSSGGHHDVNLRYGRRVFSTVGNPNVLGELMTWCVVAFTLAFLFRGGNRFFNAFVALACLVTLVMTGSRFGLLTVALGLVFIAFLLISLGRGAAGKAALLFLLVPVFVWTYSTVATSNKRTLERYQTLERPLEVDSLRQRVDDLWQDEWNDIAESPIIGHGPAKAVFTLGYSDTEYLGVAREKGVVGLLAFLGYYLFPLSLIRRGLRAAKSVEPSVLDRIPATLLTVRLGYYMIVLALIMNIVLSTFYSPMLQGFLWLWMGISARSAKTIAEASRSLPFVPAVSNRMPFPMRIAPLLRRTSTQR
jgi:O-antigen ligase